jgi:hypothetical protein
LKYWQHFVLFPELCVVETYRTYFIHWAHLECFCALECCLTLSDLGLSCRLTGGVSLLTLSGVLCWQRLTLPAAPAALGLSAASSALAILGAARLFNLPPFRRGKLSFWLVCLLVASQLLGNTNFHVDAYPVMDLITEQKIILISFL